MSLATVYRNLEFMLKQGVVTTATVQNNQVIYELKSPEQHHHLICQDCNGSIELPHELVDPLFARIQSEHGFKVCTDHLVFFGLCAECQQAKTVAL